MTRNAEAVVEIFKMHASRSVHVGYQPLASPARTANIVIIGESAIDGFEEDPFAAAANRAARDDDVRFHDCRHRCFSHSAIFDLTGIYA